MTRDQILAGCRIAHAEFEDELGFELSTQEKMIYHSAYVAGAQYVINRSIEARRIALEEIDKVGT